MNGVDKLTESYYDVLAPYYKYLYPDWESGMKWQAEALDGVIREYFGETAQAILDVACGIGTQSIGLAKLGYRVTASDISGGEIEQARMESSRRGVAVEFQVADMKRAWDVHQRQFDVVIACDNSMPHLQSEEEILQALEQFYRCTRPGGGCIVTVRDYARLEREANRKKIYPRLVHSSAEGQVVMFDVWSFGDVDHYEITTYLVEDAGGANVRARAFRGAAYFCVEIPLLERLLREAGFREVSTLRECYFQPLLVAVK